MEKTIYAMQHNVTKRIYVGSCNNADIRIKKHIHDLLRGCHTNKELQKDFDKYGMEFSFYHLDRVEADNQFEQERKWQNALRSNEKTTGYNLSKQETTSCFFTFPLCPTVRVPSCQNRNLPSTVVE